jgi:hypothetical protein
VEPPHGTPRPADPQPPLGDETVLLPAVPEDPLEVGDHGRISPLLIGVVGIAVALFVAGAAWAVTGPARSAGTAPDSVATNAPFGQAQAGAAGTAASLTGQPTVTAHTSSRPASATPSASTAPAAGQPSPPTPTPTSGAGGSTPSGKVGVSQWEPDGALIAASVTAGSVGLSGWQATITCQPGIDTGSVQLWAASRVGAGSGASGTWLTVRDLGWNGTLAAGGTTTFGLTATRTGSGKLTCTIAVTPR